uniref:Cyclin-dependent kinase inhibitor 2C (p18, inhibits CDK4) n=1 Tax=Salarias fasciatus TaxID=181472 RepID=A0A672I688_SALFA
MAGESLSDELCNASAQGKLSEVQRLLQNGAQVNGYNSFNRTALQVAKLGSTPVVEALLAAGANPNLQDPACGLTVLHDAAVTGFRCTVRALLDHGADANLVDEWGNLPLHLAAKEGHLELYFLCKETLTISPLIYFYKWLYDRLSRSTGLLVQ